MPDGPNFAPVRTRLSHRADGTMLFSSDDALPPCDETVIDRLSHWAGACPDRTVFLERSGSGWRRMTYAELWAATGQAASAILASGCSPTRPFLIVAGNGIDHAVMMVGAMRAGVPVASLSPAYAMHGDVARLRAVAGLAGAAAGWIGPGIPAAAGAALAADGITILPPDPPAPETRAGGAAQAEVDACRPGLQTVAKLMFTSGSTGLPKAVVNTHAMLSANQLQLLEVWPTVRAVPPVLVDWLPWSHTFGGNFVLHMVLWNGGTLAIDDGRPAPALVGRTLANMAELGPTRYFNVPAGYEALVPAIEAAPDLARQAFRNLEFAFCAAAALPPAVRDRMAGLLRDLAGRSIPLIGGWGATETAPCATAIHYDNPEPACIGVPLPGVTIKLVPLADRLEMRVQGPNVMPGYWQAPEATAAAFDEEGFYRIGDAGRFVDPARPEAGLAFDGRTAENFKLTSGTWVNVGALRLKVIDALRPHAADVVIAGQDRDEVGLLIFANSQAKAAAGTGAGAGAGAQAGETSGDPDLIAFFRTALQAYNRTAGGSSMRIARFRIEDGPPSAALGEVTDKGYINQRLVLQLRARAVAELYDDDRWLVGKS